MRTLLFVLGTRPEAIKLAPVIRHLAAPAAGFHVRVVVTAQHRGMLDQALAAFELRPDYDLNLMQPGQTLAQSTGRILQALEPVLARENPACVLVQGDTTTTFAGALAAFYQRIPVAHIEAGLRTGDLAQPFPEEANRVLTTRLTSWHFPPTEQAAQHLRGEGVPEERITVTGNTGIDALLWVHERLASGALPAPLWPWPAGQTVVLVTAHRRESFGSGLDRLCAALLRLADRPDLAIVYPVHPNPQVRAAVERHLTGHPRIYLLPPQDYVPFVDLMRQARVILTDSGGVQEEAPSLGKPVLVTREKTERPEAVQAGTSQLVGTDPDLIVALTTQLLDDPAEYAARSPRQNPYGDGHASGRIAAVLRRHL